MPQANRWTRWTITTLLVALIALSWNQYLDDAAHDATLTNFKRALAIAAVARGFNGVISVAQGTEVAIQPVGVGVTLTIGEILDPLNDLIERFSGLALIASVSLGLQLTLAQMLASPWVSAVMTAAVIGYLIVLWRAPALLGRRDVGYAARIMGAFVFLRFLLAFMLLATHFIDGAFLAAKQDEAVAELKRATVTIEQIQERPAQTDADTAEGDFFDRTAAQISDFLDASSQTLDLEAQLAEVQAQVENSVEEIVNLSVIFLLQTLLLPVASLWLCWWALQAFWNWSRDAQSRRDN